MASSTQEPPWKDDSVAIRAGRFTSLEKSRGQAWGMCHTLALRIPTLATFEDIHDVHDARLYDGNKQ